MAGMACPLGAHYLPLPGEHDAEVIAAARGAGPAPQRDAAAPVYDERHLCHSPQERLFIDGQWHEGLLPPVEALPAGAARAHAGAVPALRRGGRSCRAGRRLPHAHRARGLDAGPRRARRDAVRAVAGPRRASTRPRCAGTSTTAAATTTAPAPRRCRPGPASTTSPAATAFMPPATATAERDGVLTWPEGNGWLAERLAAPLRRAAAHRQRGAARRGAAATRSCVDLWNEREQRVERWSAPQLVLALPLFVAARLLDSAAAGAARRPSRRCATRPGWWPTCSCDRPPLDRGGAPPSWDNVLYGSAALGYVDAMHQSLRAHPGPTVLQRLLGARRRRRRAAARGPPAPARRTWHRPGPGACSPTWRWRIPTCRSA